MGKLGMGNTTGFTYDKNLSSGEWLGRPTPIDTSRLPAGIKFKDVVRGPFNTCAISTANIGYCWGGQASSKHLGDGRTYASGSFKPYPEFPLDMSNIPGTKQVKSIAVGRQALNAVSVDGELFSWGYDGNGAFGNGPATTNQSSDPVPANYKYTNGITDFRSVSAINRYACAVSTSGQAFCWGIGSTHLVCGSDNCDSDTGGSDALSPVPIVFQ